MSAAATLETFQLLPLNHEHVGRQSVCRTSARPCRSNFSGEHLQSLLLLVVDGHPDHCLSGALHTQTHVSTCKPVCLYVYSKLLLLISVLSLSRRRKQAAARRRDGGMNRETEGKENRLRISQHCLIDVRRTANSYRLLF